MTLSKLQSFTNLKNQSWNLWLFKSVHKATWKSSQLKLKKRAVVNLHTGLASYSFEKISLPRITLYLPQKWEAEDTYTHRHRCKHTHPLFCHFAHISAYKHLALSSQDTVMSRGLGISTHHCSDPLYLSISQCLSVTAPLDPEFPEDFIWISAIRSSPTKIYIFHHRY